MNCLHNSLLRSLHMTWSWRKAHISKIESMYIQAFWIKINKLRTFIYYSRILWLNSSLGEKISTVRGFTVELWGWWCGVPVPVSSSHMCCRARNGFKGHVVQSLHFIGEEDGARMWSSWLSFIFQVTRSREWIWLKMAEHQLYPEEFHKTYQTNEYTDLDANSQPTLWGFLPLIPFNCLGGCHT